MCLDYVGIDVAATCGGDGVRCVGHNVGGIVFATRTTSAHVGAEVLCVEDFTHTPWTVTLFCIRVSNLLLKLPHYGVFNVCVKTLVYIRPRVRVSFPFLFLD